MDKRPLLLKGLPKRLLTKKWEETRLFRPSGFQQLSELLHSGEPVVYLYADGGVIIDRILEDGRYSFSDILAVDFVQLLEDKLDNNKSYTIPKAKLLYIYNIGGETSNAQFADKVLAQAVKSNADSNNSVIISSDNLMVGTFGQTYPKTNAFLDLKLQVQYVT